MPRYDLECEKCKALTIVYLLADFALTDVGVIACEFCGAKSLKISGYFRDTHNQVSDLHEKIRALKPVDEDDEEVETRMPN